MRSPSLIAVVLVATSAAMAAAAENHEQVARQLISATVTVRVSPAAAEPNQRTEEVTVVSGVSLGEGWIITLVDTSAKSRFRVTLSDGEQADAKLRVLDHYTNLCLLAIDQSKLPGLSLAREIPQAGAAVLTAAAAGIDKPLVSAGILSGADRSLAGSGLPPLLQCDVRTTETSNGAAVVNERGELIGLIAATANQKGGWTFAVPVAHVERILRAKNDPLAASGVVELERRQPLVGMTLAAGPAAGSVVVERVTPGEPADRAGIKPGDTILEADGRKLRSAYQAVALILKKQPGDTMEFVVRHGDDQKTIAVTLSGVAAPVAGSAGPTEIQRNQVDVVRVGPNQLEVRRPGDNRPAAPRPGESRPVEVREVAVDPPADDVSRLPPRSEATLLRQQIDKYAEAIVQLRDELRRRDAAHARTIEQLTEEIQRLRKQLGEK